MRPLPEWLDLEGGGPGLDFGKITNTAGVQSFVPLARCR